MFAEPIVFVSAGSAKDVLAVLQAHAVVKLAIALADDTARSDVECYALAVTTPEGTFYDVDRPYESGVAGDVDAGEAVAIARRAVNYIKSRGDVFPWHMKRHLTARNLVRFEPKDQAECADKLSKAEG